MLRKLYDVLLAWHVFRAVEIFCSLECRGEQWRASKHQTCKLPQTTTTTTHKNSRQLRFELFPRYLSLLQNRSRKFGSKFLFLIFFKFTRPKAGTRKVKENEGMETCSNSGAVVVAQLVEWLLLHLRSADRIPSLARAIYSQLY